MPNESKTTVPPLASLKVVVDPTLPRDELRVHPAMYSVLKEALLEADTYRPFLLPFQKEKI